MTVPPGVVNPSRDLTYPDDGLIRHVALELGRHDVIQTLDTIMKFVLGDAPRVFEMAEVFAQNETFEHARAEVNDAITLVAGKWEGNGFEQFSRYAGTVCDALSANQDAIRDFASALSAAATAVMDGYIALLQFIGDCLASLAGLGMSLSIALATAPIPILDFFTAADTLAKVAEFFEKFLQSANNGMADLARVATSHLATAVQFTGAGAKFQRVPALPSMSGMDDSRQWRIDPSASPDLR